MTPGSQRTVLLVDDEPEIRRALAATLARAVPGVQVRTAGSGAEALEILARESVDVIVSDFRMPGMDGIEFLGRSMQPAPRASRVMITAYPDALLAARALNEGHISRFIVKPFSSREVSGVLLGLLEERDQRADEARRLAHAFAALR